MNSILRHSAAATVAVTLLIIVLGTAALKTGHSHAVIVAFAMSMGTAFGACITENVILFVDKRDDQMAKSIGARLAHSLADYPQAAVGMPPTPQFAHLVAANDDQPLALAA